MKHLGNIIEVQLKTGYLSSRSILQVCGDLYADGSSLVLDLDESSTRTLLPYEGRPLVSLAYSTARFDPRRCEHSGGRSDGRPFEHDFVKRPALEWDPTNQQFVLRGIEFQHDQLREPFFIAS